MGCGRGHRDNLCARRARLGQLRWHLLRGLRRLLRGLRRLLLHLRLRLLLRLRLRLRLRGRRDGLGSLGLVGGQALGGLVGRLALACLRVRQLRLSPLTEPLLAARERRRLALSDFERLGRHLFALECLRATRLEYDLSQLGCGGGNMVGCGHVRREIVAVLVDARELGGALPSLPQLGCGIFLQLSLLLLLCLSRTLLRRRFAQRAVSLLKRRAPYRLALRRLLLLCGGIARHRLAVCLLERGSAFGHLGLPLREAQRGRSARPTCARLLARRAILEQQRRRRHGPRFCRTLTHLLWPIARRQLQKQP